MGSDAIPLTFSKKLDSTDCSMQVFFGEIGFLKWRISPFIPAYRLNYSTWPGFIRLIKEWREVVDNNFVVGGVFMDFSKAFDCIPHDLLIAKLKVYGFRWLFTALPLPISR